MKSAPPDFDDDDFSFGDVDKLTFEDDDALPSQEDESPLREYVAALPVLSPLAISDELERHGYKGQDDQRRALALMAYRHVRRLKRLHVDGEPYGDLPPKQNLLLVGPTGCGKT
ncbi:MAG TPA: hypothetical protein VFX96_10370, partial [Pyrinomonadaceae bacterium]|nr:hypothetical protein [Pyrinomonadaceae bacterium]